MKLTVLFIFILLALFVVGTIKAYKGEGLTIPTIIMGIISLFLFYCFTTSLYNLL